MAKACLLRKKKCSYFYFCKNCFRKQKKLFFSKMNINCFFEKSCIKLQKGCFLFMFSNRKKKTVSKTFFSKIKTETIFCLKKILFFFKKLKKTVYVFFLNRNWKQKCFQKPILYKIKTELIFCFKNWKIAVSVLFKKKAEKGYFR